MFADPVATGGRARRLVGSSYRGRLWPFPGALTPALLTALLCFSSAQAQAQGAPPKTGTREIDKPGTTDITGPIESKVRSRAAVHAKKGTAGKHTLTLKAKGVFRSTAAGGAGLRVDRKDFVFIINDGEIITLDDSDGIEVGIGADNFEFTMRKGAISTSGDDGVGFSSRADNVTFTMQDGSITTAGRRASAIDSSGEKFQFKMQGGEATTSGERAMIIALNPKGEKDADPAKTFEHLLEIGAGASASTTGDSAHGIEIVNNLGKARTKIAIAGSLTVNGKDAVALRIEDADVTRVEITADGKLHAKGSAKVAILAVRNAPLKLTVSGQAEVIGDIDTSGGDDSITLDGGTITGDISMGEGVDTLTLNGGAIINGDINMGGGNDTLTINGAAARINGVSSRPGDKKDVVIKMGAGDDIVKLKSLANLPYGMIDGEGGNDTIDLTGLLNELRGRRRSSLLFAWRSFEVEQGVAGMAEEPDPLPPDEKEGGEEEEEVEGGKEEEENAGAPDEKGAEEKASGPDEKVGKSPVKEAEEKAGAPDEKEAAENAGGASGNGNGGGQALASGPSGQQFGQRELDKYGPYLIGINLPGQAGYDPDKEKIVYAFNPSGQAVEAQALVGLTDALHDLGARRLGRGGSSARRAARPLQVAASERIPGLLFRDRRPLVWGEAFGLYQRRAQDGFASGYAMNQKGVALGVEQGFRGERARLGLLVGYARAALRTRPWDIRTDSDSFFAGVYGRQRLDGLYESLYVQGSLNVSLSKHDNRRRTMNHDARGKYSSWGVSPSLTVGRVLRLETVLPGGELSLEPSVDLRYSAGFYDDYRETGEPGLVMTIKERVQQSLSGRLNLAGIYDLPDGGGSVSLRLGLSHRRLFASDLEGSFSDRAFKFKSAASNNVTLGHAGVDIAVNLAEGLSLNGRYEYSHSIGTVSDRTNSGQLSLVYRF